jgi:hypothetical protein
MFRFERNKSCQGSIIFQTFSQTTAILSIDLGRTNRFSGCEKIDNFELLVHNFEGLLNQTIGHVSSSKSTTNPSANCIEMANKSQVRIVDFDVLKN